MGGLTGFFKNGKTYFLRSDFSIAEYKIDVLEKTLLYGNGIIPQKKVNFSKLYILSCLKANIDLEDTNLYSYIITISYKVLPFFAG